MKFLFPVLLGVAMSIMYEKLIGIINDKYIVKNNVNLPLKMKICMFIIFIIVILGIVFLSNNIFKWD